MSKEAADILRNAKAKIDTPEKWAHSAADFNAGKHCPATAINTTAFNRHTNDAFELFQQVVGSKIAAWNDAPDRTHAEVMQAFDKAIALAESK